MHFLNTDFISGATLLQNINTEHKRIHNLHVLL